MSANPTLFAPRASHEESRPRGGWYPRELARIGSPATIVMYHAVSPRLGPYAVSPAAFLRHITCMADSYRVVPLQTLGRLLAHGEWSERIVCLTFDDAYVDFLEEAFPILLERRLHSTIFAPAGRLGRHNDWETDPAYPRRKLLAAAQLRALQSTGLVEIGSHAVDHVRLTSLRSNAVRTQARDSRRALEDTLGAPVTSFSYPYGQPGDFSSRTERVLAAAGYDMAVTTHWGTRQVPDERLRLRRVWFVQDDDDDVVRAKIEGAYDWRAWKERLGHAARSLGLMPSAV